MFRAKITSDEQRKQVLNSAKTLKGTQYDKVYISRDLTRAQRTAFLRKDKLEGLKILLPQILRPHHVKHMTPQEQALLMHL